MAILVFFGFLTRPRHFDERSNVYFAAWGIPDKDYLRAVAAVTGLDSEITVDLIRMEEASPSLCRQAGEGMAI